jgi:hypothetical protein
VPAKWQTVLLALQPVLAASGLKAGAAPAARSPVFAAIPASCWTPPFLMQIYLLVTAKVWQGRHMKRPSVLTGDIRGSGHKNGIPFHLPFLTSACCGAGRNQGPGPSAGRCSQHHTCMLPPPSRVYTALSVRSPVGSHNTAERIHERCNPGAGGWWCKMHRTLSPGLAPMQDPVPPPWERVTIYARGSVWQR